MVKVNIIFITIFGFIIGSFLNVCIYRIPRGESIAYPPSHCTNCGNNIKWYDLIPIISYIFLKGRCRYCREKISIRYPVIELITGILYLMVYIKYGMTLECLKYITFVTILIIVGMIDFDTTDVYFSTTLIGTIFACVFIILSAYYLHDDFKQYIFGGLFGGGIISIIILLTRGMGWGDAEICFFSGLFLGFKLALVMMFFSFIFGAAISLILVTLKKKTRKDYIPFGPFVALASIFTIFVGNKILLWYGIL